MRTGKNLKMRAGKIERTGAAERAYRGILQLLFPLRCPVCDGIVRQAGEKVCVECLGRLKLLTPPWCMKCGKKLSGEDEYCTDCRRREHVFLRGRGFTNMRAPPCPSIALNTAEEENMRTISGNRWRSIWEISSGVWSRMR